MMEYSPKSSPRGSRSPAMAAGGGEGGGGAGGGNPLKFSIALGGQKPTIIQKGPFYLMKQETIPVSETGANNLMSSKGLESSYIKLTTKKMKDSLSSFLPSLPGVVDTPGAEDNSSLRGLIDKPPVGGKELHPLSHAQLAGFRLHPGPLPDQYRISMQVQTKKKKKAKKSKHRGGGETPLHDASGGGGGLGSMGSMGSLGSSGTLGGSSVAADADDRERRREKKHKNKDKDKDATESDKERKKKKKEKKKKKNKDDKD